MVREIDFTFDEAVRTMGLTPVKLQRMIDEGKFPTVQVGGSVRIPRHAILQYFAEVSPLLTKDRKK